MSDNKDTFFAFLLGGIVGAAIGILYAPRSGKETRENIKKLSDDIVDNVNDFSQDISEKGKKICKEGHEKVLSSKDKIGEVFCAGKKVLEKYTKS